MLQDKQEIVWEYGAEADKGEAGLVFGVRSSVVLEASWRLEALGGREPFGFLIVKRAGTRKCHGRLAGRPTEGCWNNPSLASWGCLGQIWSPRKWALCGLHEPSFRKRRSGGSTLLWLCRLISL